MIPYTTPFLPRGGLTALRQTLQDQDLTQDLGLRLSESAKGLLVSLYALGGATSWPSERYLDGEAVDFEITAFLGEVLADGEHAEAFEHGTGVHVQVGHPPSPAPRASSFQPR